MPIMDVTLITGASSGIGRSLARRLARHAPVALVARRADLLETLAGEIRAAGGQAIAVAADVTDRDAMRSAVARVESDLGPVTCLVANAGGGEPTFVDEFDAAAIERVIRLNLMGVVNAIEAVLPSMLARGSGQLVATGSLAASRGLPTAAAYSAAKAGVANFMESLRIDLRSRGIVVTLLVPGFVDTRPRKPGRSKRKPFRMELEAATARMETAILRGAPRVVLPRRLAYVAGILRLLPCAYYDRLLAGRGRRKPEAHTSRTGD